MITRRKKILLHVFLLCLCCGLVLGIYHYKALEAEQTMGLLQSFCAGTENQRIHVTWSNHKPWGGDRLVLVISRGTDEERIPLPVWSQEYIYSDGTHGERISFTLERHRKDEIIESYSDDATFLDFTKIQDIPIISIDTATGEDPWATLKGAPDGYWGVTIEERNEVIGQMTLSNGSCTEVSDKITICVRGNTSAWPEKRPYRVELSQEQDLLCRSGNGYENTDWLLLPCNQSLVDLVGGQVAALCKLEWVPQEKMVNLILNGDYKGTYWLKEAVTVGEKRVNISEDGYLFEADAYCWAEPYSFYTPHQMQRMSYTFKYPKVEELTGERLTIIQDYMTNLDAAIFDGTEDYANYLDISTSSGWLLAHDLLGTWDAGGSNIFFYKRDGEETSKIHVGPLWDFDTIFLQKGDWAAVRYSGAWFFNTLYSTDERFYNHYWNLWSEISPILTEDVMAGLHAQIDGAKESVQESWDLDALRWNSSRVSLDEHMNMIQSWFEERCIWMNEQYELSNANLVQNEN